MSRQWAEFYLNRVNSTYQEYFESRYRPLLGMIIDLVGRGTVREEGIGIGSISKALGRRGITCYGFDICPKMVELAKHNNRLNSHLYDVYQDDILNPSRPESVCFADVIVTHGVLEHFNDFEIRSLMDRYRETSVSVHYVPLIGYEKPSFGDERLLSYEYWMDLVKPNISFLFNDDRDLLFVTK